METLSNAYYLPNICKLQMLKPSLQSSIRIKQCYLSAVSSGNFLKIEVAVYASNGGVPDFLGRHSLMAGLRILIQFFGKKRD